MTEIVIAAKTIEIDENGKINGQFFELPDMRLIGMPLKKLYPDNKIYPEIFHERFSPFPRLFADTRIRLNYKDGQTMHGTSLEGVMTPAKTPVPESYLSVNFPGGTYTIIENDDERLAKYGYVYDNLSFRIMPTWHCERICRPGEENSLFFKTLAALNKVRKISEDKDFWRHLNNIIGDEIKNIEPAKIIFSDRYKSEQEAYADFGGTAHRVRTGKTECSILVAPPDALVINASAAMDAYMIRVSLQERTIMISNGDCTLHYPLSEKTRKWLIRIIYNNHKNNFYSKVRSY